MRKLAATILSFLIVTVAVSQTSLSFYHLGRTTYQNSSLNPAWIPDGKLFIGLPGLSGVHVHVNNKLSYNQLFTKESDSVLLDINKALKGLQGQNMASAQVNVNLFHVGYRFPQGAVISLFANERVEVDALYPEQLIDYVWNGNDNFLDDKIRIGRVGAQVSHFREIGIGYAYSVNGQLDFGMRAKYLMGFFDASTPGNFKANLTSSGEFFQLEGELKNARLRTAGVDIYSEDPVNGEVIDLASHLLGSGNSGLALDLGVEYKLSRYYSVSASILDLGYINWKTNVVNHTLNDTTFTYRGVNLDGIGDVREALEDSLFNKFETNETNETYKNWLPVKAYGSWIYHYDSQLDFYGTVGMRLIQGQLKMLYGGGMTRRFGRVFTGSLSATKLPQQFFNIGAAFAVNGGPVQFYMAADQVINFSAPDAKAFDFRFGINFRFMGRDENLASNSSTTSFANGKPGSNGTLKGPKGVDASIFHGRQVKTKKRDGIYSIIKKQKKRDIKNKRTEKRAVQRRSLNGRAGVKNKNEEE
ncbi:MAG: DUF5723 family protein [Cyclobacteriaceae bacterium]